uniref:Uncharacterized protein n=1 Tax=Rhizophora mucronata TaxID=61149 RepID=A0A2P2N373_RHIMU
MVLCHKKTSQLLAVTAFYDLALFFSIPK